MLLSLPETHTCWFWSEWQPFCFCANLGYKPKQKLSGNDIYLFCLLKHDLKANFLNMVNSIDIGIHSDPAILVAILFLCKLGV